MTAEAVEQALGSNEVRTPSSCAVLYHEEAVIHAPVSKVWSTLIDVEHYSEWNPWLLEAHGTVAPGGSVTVKVVMSPTQTMTALHTVLAVDSEKRFCWKDAGWNAAFVYAQRCRTLTVQADGSVRFTNDLFLDGPLAGLAGLTNGAGLRAGMAAETAALKARVE